MFSIVSMPLYHDASVDSESEGDFGRAPLNQVAQCTYNFQQDRVHLTQLLLEHGADINTPNEDNVTPLHLASYYGGVEIARVLLDCGAAANSKGNQGRTPLHSVAEGRYLYSQDDGICVAQLLLGCGADVNAPDEDNKTPLHLASYYKKVEVARALLDGNAATNSKDNQGRTPLHVVAEGYSTDNDILAQLLLERGADVNAPDDDNETPLHVACYFGTIKMVMVLLNAGSNPSAKNAQGQTPLHLVPQCPYHSRGDGVGVAQLLLEHGADVNALDNNHATPSDFATHHGRTKIASLLLDYGGKTNAKIDRRPTPRHLGLKCVQFHDEPSVAVFEDWVRERRPPPTLPRLSLSCRALMGQLAKTHF
jgi:ankyrin repeat protein